ncbi:neutral/alkaline non-lysosomal ceramidase N-terminal domain-containing protein [Paenibacillus sp. GYB004]|uniref:neutral/alkaline non-lysosomal ceramidase N-terminal domain-containing protein n=1 Tax=Paenibacillus sp. GYB004 TaxID=2994393 RepID=UPI002F96B2FE
MIVEVGCAKVDITPEMPVPLAGFAVRGNAPYEGIRSRIYLRAVYMRQPGEGGAVRTALLVSADLLWWGSDRVPGLLAKLKERWGLEKETVVLHGTHSHSGPQTGFGFHRLLGAADAGYVGYLEDKVMEAVEAAAANVEPVTIERGAGECRIGVQRRRYADGQAFGGEYPDGLMDPELSVIRFRTRAGTDKAIIVHYACHPVTAHQNYVSSEFTGTAAEEMERRLGDGALCLYLQGTCGDINIFKSSAPAALTDDYDQIRYFGMKFADAASAVLNSRMSGVKPVLLQGCSYSVPLPLKPLESKEELEAIAGKRQQPYDEWAVEMLSRGDTRATELVLEMNRLDIADGFAILTMNAEVVVEYGLYIKEISSGSVWPVPYSNGMIGYVPTREQIRCGGYEPLLSTYYFYMPGRFEESIEDTLRGKLDEIVGG